MQKDDTGFASIGFVFSELEGKNSEHCCNNVKLIILKLEIHDFLHKKLNNYFKLIFYKTSKTNIENSWNWFLGIYVCYILKQEPYQYLYFLSRYGGK
jgi:hypothetical protein